MPLLFHANVSQVLVLRAAFCTHGSVDMLLSCARQLHVGVELPVHE